MASQTVSSVFIAKSDGTIFKPRISKNNVSSNKFTSPKITVSKSSNKNLVWKIKISFNKATVSEITKSVHPSDTKVQKKSVPNPQIVEYDYWIDEKTLAFCLFPKHSRNLTKKKVAVPKPQLKSKVHAYVPKSNLEPKSSIAH